jgi:WD40 repeat protein
VRVFDWESGKATGTYRGHVGSVTCMAFSPDGKTLATGGSDTTVLLWDVAAGGE